MKIDPSFVGPQQFGADDRRGFSCFGQVKSAAFSNPYYLTWGASGEPPLPIYEVSLGRISRGILPGGNPWLFEQSSARTIDSEAHLRWGPDGRGFRRLLHPNGLCLFGRWSIDQDNPYSGYFQAGSTALVVGRYSTCCTETRRGYRRSLSLVGTLYPTVDEDDPQRHPTASFITQEDIGGARTLYINDAILRNAPDTTPWQRGIGGIPTLLLTGVALLRVDRQPTMRQVYEIAELMKPPGEVTRAPTFMQLVVDENQPRILGDAIDFRDEVLAQIYDRGDPTPRRKLVFNIEVTDSGQTYGKLIQRRTFSGWRRIGRIEFVEAVASYNSDFVLHFHHPPWRDDKDRPETVVRTRQM